MLRAHFPPFEKRAGTAWAEARFSARFVKTSLQLDYKVRSTTSRLFGFRSHFWLQITCIHFGINRLHCFVINSDNHESLCSFP
jgi:hypothetical protein